MSKEHGRKANAKVQDSLFRHLFSTPEKAIELYNALEGTNYGPDTPVDLTTLRGFSSATAKTIWASSSTPIM